MFNIRKKPVPIKENIQRKTTPPFFIEFTVGDMVKVCSDEARVKELQNSKDCGGYSPQRMQCVLGKCVKVKHISPYCVKVEWENSEFDFHPNLLEIVGQSALIRDNSHDINHFEQNALVRINSNDINNGYEIPRPSGNDQSDSLFEAIAKGNLTQTCELVSTNLLNKKGHQGKTPISVACLHGHYDIVETLIELCADMDIKDDDGSFPIHNCALANNINILKLIIEKDENQILKVDGSGRTLLHHAIIKNNLEMTKYLTEKKIPTNIDDRFGKSAFQYTTSQTNHGITRIMTEFNSIYYSTILPPSTSIKYEENSIHNEYLQNDNQQKLNHKYTNISHMDQPAYGNTYHTLKVPSVSPLELTIGPRAASSIQEDQNKQNECTICYSRAKRVAFVNCGHTSCRECAEKLYQCHICKREITDRLQIYI